MPESRNFTVTQTRQVKVTANTLEGAAQIAQAAFAHGQNSDGGVPFGKGPEGVWGNTSSRVREMSLDVEAVY